MLWHLNLIRYHLSKIYLRSIEIILDSIRRTFLCARI